MESFKNKIHKLRNVFVCAIFVFSFFAVALNASAATLALPANNLGLVGYWPMNEGSGNTTDDYSGYGNNGTLVSSPAWVGGRMGQALSFNGTTQYVAVKNGPILSGNTYWTMSLWVKTTLVSGGSIGIYCERGATDMTDLLIYGKSAFVIIRNDAGNILQITGTAIISDNKWHNVTVVKNANTVYLYVDGKQDKTGNWPNPDNFTNSGIQSRIASEPSGSGNFAGSVDETRLYNRALSATEVAKLYQSGLIKINSSQNSQVTNGLVGLWSFDGADMGTTTAYDRSGSGNNGTVVNGATPVLGKVGQALSFNGTNQYVSTAMTLGSVAQVSVSAWVYATTTNFGGAGSISFTANSLPNVAAGGFNLGFDNSGNFAFKFTVGNGISQKSASSYGGPYARPVPRGWYHLVGVYDGANVYLYINGTLQPGVSAMTGNVATTYTTNVGVGYNPYASGGGGPPVAGAFLPGSLDDVRIYNRALTQSEITQLYNMGAGTHVNASRNNIPGSTLQSGLVGMWSFNGADISGNTVYDRSVSGNNGTINNGAVPAIGKIGQALSFNGVNQYMQSNLSKASLGSTFSISLWLEPTGAQSTAGILQIADSLTNANPFILLQRTTSNTTKWFLNGPSRITETVNDNTWQHMVLTYDGTTWNAYKNGVSDGTYVGPLGTNTGASTWVGNGYNGYFNGSVDDMRVYNRVLTQSEITQLYRQGGR